MTQARKRLVAVRTRLHVIGRRVRRRGRTGVSNLMSGLLSSKNELLID